MNIYIHREIWADRFSVYMRRHTGNGYMPAIAEPIVFRVMDKSQEGKERPPCMAISQDEAQQFIDALWMAGIRPTEGTGSAGSLAATQKHLDDMRHLVFKENPLKK